MSPGRRTRPRRRRERGTPVGFVTMFGRDDTRLPSTLNFPNASRSFDPTRDRVRFWGYDRSLEIAFFVEGAALRSSLPGTESQEADLLRAFDRMVDRIYEAARAAYARDYRSAYVLTAEDL